jgi:hypothetical protein
VHSFFYKALHGVDCPPSVRELFSTDPKKDQKQGEGCSAKLWDLLERRVEDESRSPLKARAAGHSTLFKSAFISKHIFMWYDDAMAKKQASRKPASGKAWQTHLRTRKASQKLPDTSKIPWLPKSGSAKLRKCPRAR